MDGMGVDSACTVGIGMASMGMAGFSIIGISFEWYLPGCGKFCWPGCFLIGISGTAVAGMGSTAIGMVGMGMTVMVGMDIVVIGMVSVEVAGMAMEVGNKVTLFALLTGVLVTFF
jgi:hypothetical protein